jgi:sulfate adenylyltransferase subunit 2
MRQGAIVPVNRGDPASSPRPRPVKNHRPAGALPHRRRHHLHAPVESDADTVEKIIAETATTTITERGATRLDDQTSRRLDGTTQEGRLFLMSAIK